MLLQVEVYAEGSQITGREYAAGVVNSHFAHRWYFRSTFCAALQRGPAGFIQIIDHGIGGLTNAVSARETLA